MHTALHHASSSGPPGVTRIVGLGASAGGLAALEKFIAQVPAGSGMAYVVVQPGTAPAVQALQDWLNSRVGKTQRVADVVLAEQLPRSEIGKVLKRELRDLYARTHTSAAQPQT